MRKRMKPVTSVEDIRARTAEDPETGCWVWQRSLQKQGYGILGFRGATMLAHRVAMWMATGEEPNGLVLHRCNNKPCCNPDHLYIGDKIDNYADLRATGWRPPTRGSRNGFAKLTETDVLAIRQRLADGHTHARIAASFQVSLGLVSMIRNRKYWAHI